MTLKNNRAPLLSNIKLHASFHHHMWIQSWVTVRKRLGWVVTSVTLTFDLWPWPFAWTLLWSLVKTPENFMMIRWWEHSQKVWQTDGQTENTICRAAWSQLKKVGVYKYRSSSPAVWGHWSVDDEGPRSLVQVYPGTRTYNCWLPHVSYFVVPKTGALMSKCIILHR